MTYITTVPEAGCWLWAGGWTRDGYGKAWDSKSKSRKLAHRISYEIAHGPIPAGALVCHKCDTPACVNPWHLFLGDNFANMRDMHAKGRNRQPRGENHIRHKLTDQAVREIRVVIGSNAKVAKEYGVSRALISMIRSGKARGSVS